MSNQPLITKDEWKGHLLKVCPTTFCSEAIFYKCSRFFSCNLLVFTKRLFWPWGQLCCARQPLKTHPPAKKLLQVQQGHLVFWGQPLLSWICWCTLRFFSVLLIFWWENSKSSRYYLSQKEKIKPLDCEEDHYWG